MDIAIASGGAMPKDAHLVVEARFPAALIDLDASVADLELNPAWREGVKAEHSIVWMLAERFRDPHAVVEGAIVDPAQILERPRLEHEVVDRFGQAFAERDRMVAPIGVEEGDVDVVTAEKLAFDAIAQPKVEELFEKTPTFLERTCAKRDMAEAEIAGFEASRDERQLRWIQPIGAGDKLDGQTARLKDLHPRLGETGRSREHLTPDIGQLETREEPT